MQEEKEFVGTLTNRAQADNEEEAESTNSENTNLSNLLVEKYRFHSEKQFVSKYLLVPC